MNRLRMVVWFSFAALAGIGGLVPASVLAADAKAAPKPARPGGCFCGAVRYEITGPADGGARRYAW